MPKLPTISGRESVSAFSRAGWAFARQRGSHMILIRPGSLASLSIPDHKELAKGTLRALIRAADLTLEEFLALLD
jgi:predicted RNA binding protein YcfA (HicA-like mRNA interferase family)